MRDEEDGGAGDEGREHGACDYGLDCGDGGVGIALRGWLALGSDGVRKDMGKGEGKGRGGKGGKEKYHLRPSNHPALNNRTRFRAKPSWIPNHQISQLPHLHTSNNMAHSLSYSWIYRVFTDISFHSEIICACTFIFFQCSSLDFVLMCCVPGTQDDFAATAHGLGIGGHHGDGAEIVEDVFSGYGFGADAGFGECYVFGDVFGEVVTDH